MAGTEEAQSYDVREDVGQHDDNVTQAHVTELEG
jgi:hypothetical protein